MSKSKTGAAESRRTTAPNRNCLTIHQGKDETGDQAKARAYLTPQVGAASTVRKIMAGSDLDIMSLATELQEQAALVQGGNLQRLESMLTTQAHTLDVLFNTLAQRAALNLGEYLDASERYLKLAFKAQNQCRATLESFAAIKNPPLIYAQQANIANGPQQVNNGTPAAGGGSEPVRAPAGAGGKK